MKYCSSPVSSCNCSSPVSVCPGQCILVVCQNIDTRKTKTDDVREITMMHHLHDEDMQEVNYYCLQPVVLEFVEQDDAHDWLLSWWIVPMV